MGRAELSASQIRLDQYHRQRRNHEDGKSANSHTSFICLSRRGCPRTLLRWFQTATRQERGRRDRKC